MPSTTLDLIKRERVSAMQGPPSLFSQLLANHEHDASILRQLRFVSTGASPIPPGLIYGLQSAGVGHVCSSYALTECNLATTTRKNDPPEVIANSVGRPSSGISLKLVDEHGEEVADGEAGEILLHGFAVMAGYFGDDELTNDTIDPDGWLRTGDIGRLREDGNLQIVGRKKEMIIVHGYNVYPAEVEMQLMSSGLLENVAVVAEQSRLAGEQTAAFVVPAKDSPVTRQDIMAWAKRNLADYKVPSRVIVRDSLPLNINGKIDKIALKAVLSES
jgi:acyl-CoA synthetase (AMP-forming)/AMP-acid ligase II